MYIQPEYSTILHPVTKPSYVQQAPRINRYLCQFPKLSTPNEVYVQNFRYLTSTQYWNYVKIYTDGSKTVDGVAAASIAEGGACLWSTLPKEATIFSAELHALKLALDTISSSSHRYFVIFSDSRSFSDGLKI